MFFGARASKGSLYETAQMNLVLLLARCDDDDNNYGNRVSRRGEKVQCERFCSTTNQSNTGTSGKSLNLGLENSHETLSNNYKICSVPFSLNLILLYSKKINNYQPTDVFL